MLFSTSLQDENKENKKSSEKMSDILDEIEIENQNDVIITFIFYNQNGQENDLQTLGVREV